MCMMFAKKIVYHTHFFCSFLMVFYGVYDVETSKIIWKGRLIMQKGKSYGKQAFRTTQQRVKSLSDS